MSEIFRAKYAGSALPGNAEVVVIYTTGPTSGNGAGQPQANFHQMVGCNRILLDVTNDQSGTLKCYQSVDRGLNWVRVYADIVVAAPAANTTNQYDILVEPFPDFKVEWTNNATPQTVFRVNVVGVDQREVAI